MININLIPVEQRKKSGSFLGAKLNLPRDIVLGFGFALACLLVMIHVFLVVAWVLTHIQAASLEGQWKQLEPDKKAVDSIVNEAKEINQKMKAAKDLIVAPKSPWSKKLNLISDALPKGVWLTKILIDEKSLVLQGMVVSKQHQEIMLVGNLATLLKKEPAFASDFKSIDVSGLNKARYNNLEVSQFTITAVLK